MQMSPTVMDAPRQDPEDEKLFVQFYMGSMKNEDKSREEGHPVYDSRPFIKIMVPGDRNSTIDTLASPQYQQRFARQWSLFQQNESQAISGFPLKEWPGVSRAQVEEMNHLNVYTVEQLATLPDVYGAKLMGFQDLKRKAEAYLAAAKDSAFVDKVSAQNEELKTQLAATQQELARLSAKFDKLQAKG